MFVRNSNTLNYLDTNLSSFLRMSKSVNKVTMTKYLAEMCKKVGMDNDVDQRKNL